MVPPRYTRGNIVMKCVTRVVVGGFKQNTTPASKGVVA